MDGVVLVDATTSDGAVAERAHEAFERSAFEQVLHEVGAGDAHRGCERSELSNERFDEGGLTEVVEGFCELFAESARSLDEQFGFGSHAGQFDFVICCKELTLLIGALSVGIELDVVDGLQVELSVQICLDLLEPGGQLDGSEFGSAGGLVHLSFVHGIDVVSIECFDEPHPLGVVLLLAELNRTVEGAGLGIQQKGSDLVVADADLEDLDVVNTEAAFIEDETRTLSTFSRRIAENGISDDVDRVAVELLDAVPFGGATQA